MYVFSHDACVCFVDGVLSLLRAAKITCAICRMMFAFVLDCVLSLLIAARIICCMFRKMLSFASWMVFLAS